MVNPLLLIGYKDSVMINKILYPSMFGALILLMANQMIGAGLIHEILGLLLALLALVHVANNLKWWKVLKHQCKIAPFKTITTIGLTLSLIAAVISGLIISRHLIFIKPLLFLMSSMRIVHHYSVYWVLIFTALHIGIHGYILMVRYNLSNFIAKLPLFVKAILTLAIVGYGAYAFWYEAIYEYLFFMTPYTFFDFNQPLWNFFLNYVTLSLGIAIIAYGIELKTRK